MSHRKEQKEALRQERMARQQAVQDAARRKKLVGYVVAGVLVAALLVAAVVLATSGGDDDAAGGSGGGFPSGSVPAREITEFDPAVKAASGEFKEFPEQGRDHTEEPVENYSSNPPTSGPHHPAPAEDGAYLESPAKEHLVHSLEHGRVIIQFAPNVPDSVKGGLKALFDEDPYHVILVPNNTDMPYEVAVTSWTRLLGFKKFDDKAYDAIRAFKDNYRDQAPEQVP